MDQVPRTRAPKIRVVVRKRPLTSKEAIRHEEDILERRSSVEIVVVEQKSKVDLTKYIEEHRFLFDNVYDETTSNMGLYIEAVKPLVEAAFERAKVTCFAYGQTGSGKTYTMMGNPEDYQHAPGMFLLAAQDLFQILENKKYAGFSVWVSFYEIYCGKLYDLFNDRGIVHARENHKGRVVIANLEEVQVEDWMSLMEQIQIGLNIRTTGVTGMNMDSSRSHAVLQIVIKDAKRKAYGKLSFIDLAGSERGADTVEQNKQTRIDGAEINKSLLALKECIRALDQDKRHTPFRGSKLTQVLKDSFIGNCRTTMIANVSPSKSCCEHTLNTLRYADRVKELKKQTAGGMGYTAEESLAKQLMLPRQPGNSRRFMVNTDQSQEWTSSCAAQIPPSPPQLQQQQSLFVPSVTKTAHNFHSSAGKQAASHVNPHQQAKIYGVKRTQTSLKAPTLTSHSFNNSEHSTSRIQRATIVRPTGNKNLTPKSKNMKITLSQRLNVQNEQALLKASLDIRENKQESAYKQRTLQPPTRIKQYVFEEEESETSKQQSEVHSRIPKLKNSQSKKKVEPVKPTRAVSPHLNKAHSTQAQEVPSVFINFTPKKPGQHDQTHSHSSQLQSKIPLRNKSTVGRPATTTPSTQKYASHHEGARGEQTAHATEERLKAQQEDLNLIKDEHSRLVHSIIKQEEQFTGHHRQHVDRMVEFIKKVRERITQEMKLADEIEQPDSDLKGYVETLDSLLRVEFESISSLHSKLLKLKEFIKKEEEMENNFLEKQEEIEVFDLNNPDIDFQDLCNGSKQGQGGDLPKGDPTDDFDSEDLNARQGEQGDVFDFMQYSDIAGTPPHFD